MGTQVHWLVEGTFRSVKLLLKCHQSIFDSIELIMKSVPANSLIISEILILSKIKLGTYWQQHFALQNSPSHWFIKAARTVYQSNLLLFSRCFPVLTNSPPEWKVLLENILAKLYFSHCIIFFRFINVRKGISFYYL